MDDYGNEIQHEGAANVEERLWCLFHFYGFIGPEGCIHFFCAQFCDPKDNVI